MSTESRTADTTAASTARSSFSSGWLEVCLFALALSALNISYAIGHQLGVHPVALLVWAMPVAAVSLLLFGGLGRDWARIMAHPLSIVVGGGIIAMEATYYMLLGYSTPTDGSLIVRVSVPIAMALGFLLSGRRPRPIAVLGAVVIGATLAWYLTRMASPSPLTAAALAAGCGINMAIRSFAAEHHPWNRNARTILEKMRITGIVLLLASVIGAALLFAAMAATEQGLLAPPKWLPRFHQLADPSAIMVGVAVGALVLTAMQYLGFSVVVKLGTERFIAATALIPIVTLGVQELVVRAGFLAPIPFDWSVLPAMAGVMAGVALVIAGNRRG